MKEQGHTCIIKAYFEVFQFDTYQALIKKRNQLRGIEKREHMVQGRRVGGNDIINTNVYCISFFRCLSTMSSQQRGINAEG